MKKIIFLLVFIFTIALSKAFCYSTITFYNMSTGPFVAGDSIYFDLGWNSSSTTDRFQITLFSKNGLGNFILEDTTFYGATRKYSGIQYTDHACGCYRIGYKIPVNCETDSFTVGITNIQVNDPHIYISALSVVTGISTSLPDKKEETHYYDQLGNEILKPDHGFYIWKTSSQSGKVFRD